MMSKALHFGRPSLLKIRAAGLRRASGEGPAASDVIFLSRRFVLQSDEALRRRLKNAQIPGPYQSVGLKTLLREGGYQEDKSTPVGYSPFESQHRTMSWLSRETSNADLIRQMQAFGAIKSERVANVMREVDRGLFVPPSEDAYQDAPQPIGFNATISGLSTLQKTLIRSALTFLPSPGIL